MDYYEQHKGSKHGGRSILLSAFALRQLGKEAFPASGTILQD